MKKTLRAGCVIIALVLLFAAGTAGAELKRGSRGEDVRELQRQLIDVGALDGEADGIFGKKTEKAVKSLQAMWGFRRTGRTDDDFMNELMYLWHAVTGTPMESGADMSGEDRSGGACGFRENSAAAEITYCRRHAGISYLRQNYADNGRMPAGVQKAVWRRIRDLSLEYILQMYEEWERALPKASKSRAREARNEFEAAWAEAAPDLAEANGPGTVKAVRKEAEWLEKWMARLCSDLHGGR